MDPSKESMLDILLIVVNDKEEQHGLNLNHKSTLTLITKIKVFFGVRRFFLRLVLLGLDVVDFPVSTAETTNTTWGYKHI